MDIIEHSMDEKRVISWMRGHWYWSFFYSALYLALIFFGQKWMKDRPPYNLRRALCMWSTGLSVFSFYAFYRTFPLVYSSLKVGGFQHVVCDINLYTGSKGIYILSAWHVRSFNDIQWFWNLRTKDMFGTIINMLCPLYIELEVVLFLEV